MSGHRARNGLTMPLHFKIPAYLGNALLLLMGVVIVFQEPLLAGILLIALALLNLYLVRKLDLMSREEAWLASELVKQRLREELAAAYAANPPPPPAPPAV